MSQMSLFGPAWYPLQGQWMRPIGRVQGRISEDGGQGDFELDLQVLILDYPISKV